MLMPTLNHITRLSDRLLVEWSKNIEISDHSPEDYFPQEIAAFTKGGGPKKEIAQMMYWHALPEEWEKMDYHEFLKERQKLMAQVIRDGFKKLL